MSALWSLLNRRLTSSVQDVHWGQALCYVAAMTVLLLVVLKLAALPVSEFELLLGLLAGLSVSLLLVILGLVLPRGHAT